MSVSPMRRDRGTPSSVKLGRLVLEEPSPSAKLASFARSVGSPSPIMARSSSIDFSSTEIVGGGAGIDGAFGATLWRALVPVFVGGGADALGAAVGAAAACAGGAAGGAIDGTFGGPGTLGSAFVAGPGGGTTLAAFGTLGVGGLDKLAKGRGATGRGRADGVAFTPAGVGTLVPAALSAVGGFGGVGGSLGGMKSGLPTETIRQRHCSSPLRAREES